MARSRNLCGGALVLFASLLAVTHAMKDVTDLELDQQIRTPGVCVMAVFYAPWSGQCRMLEDTFKQVSGDLKDDPKVFVTSIDGDKYSDIRKKYNVRRFPTVKVFPDGGDEAGVQFTGRYTRNSLAHFVKQQCNPVKSQVSVDEPSKGVVTKGASSVVDISPYDMEMARGKNWLVGIYSNKDSDARMFAREFKKVGDTFLNFRDVEVAKINADKYPEVRENLGVMSTPAVLWFEDGEEQPDNYPATSELVSDELIKWVHSRRGLEIGIDEMVFSVCDEHHMAAVDEVGSKYQYIQMFHSKFFGKALFIDGTLMTTERDESHYHEMLAHVPLAYLPNASNFLIMGGGDGGVLNQVLKHPNIQEATLVDIDEMVIRMSQKHFQRMGSAFNNTRSNLVFRDASKWVKEQLDAGKAGTYDAIVIDRTTDNQGNSLIEHEYFRNSKRLLKDRGVLVFNEASCSWETRVLSEDLADMKNIFKYAFVYQVWLPTYLSGHYCYFFLSDTVNPVEEMPDIDWKAFGDKNMVLDYYNKGIHNGAFSLPTFVKRIIQRTADKRLDGGGDGTSPNAKAAEVLVRGKNRTHRRAAGEPEEAAAGAFPDVIPHEAGDGK